VNIKPALLDVDRMIAELDSLLGPIVKKVLVVEDYDDYRGALQCLLEKEGYEVVEAADGEEGLRKALAEMPDLVLLDFNLPFMNGYELLQELRAAFELRRVPIIMLTGAPNRKKLQELGTDIAGFLQKPVSNAQLLAAVAEAVKNSPGRRIAAPIDEHAEAKRIPDLETADDKIEEEDVIVDLEPAKPEDEPGLEVLANDSPLVNKVNSILVQAVGLEASDIHIEPQEKCVGVRVRLNGSLKPLCNLPLALMSRLSARIKIMSNLVITECRRPQDGQFRVAISGSKIEFRVSTIPGAHGEKIVMRVLRVSKVTGRLEEMGLSARDLGCVERALQSPHGLILVTGPTGSGKTTTLYSMISTLNKPDVNIMTAEDPVEYRMPGITQIGVKPAIGLTFETVLRSFLRQDPDIMLVGEVRDLETAQIAMKASITGHLVLSTLHTNSAPAAITRLIHMGLPPFLVSASVRLVIAQRLIKTLCPSCKLQTQVSNEESRLLTDEELGRLGQMYRGIGCKACKQTGYVGRRPLFEVMPLRSLEMRGAILESRGEDALAALAAAEGMTGLRRAAIDAVGLGDTSLSEALKIVLAE
jgi:type IV pilus assembly protein PilB